MIRGLHLNFKQLLNILSLTLITIFIGKGINSIIGVFFLIPIKADIDTVKRKSSTTNYRENYRYTIRTRNSIIICNKNIFDYKRRPCIENSFSNITEEKNDNSLVDCSLNLKLLATAVSDDEEWSFALISIDSQNRLVRIGDELKDGFVVRAINWRDIVLTKGNSSCIVDMWSKELSRTVESSTSYKPSNEMLTVDTGFSPRSFEGVEVISENERVVSKEIVDKFLENPTEMLSSIRIIPYEEEGETKGVRIFGIHGNSLLGVLGIKNGDIIHSIDDNPMTSPEEILKGYMGIKGKEHISINLTRRGKKMSIDVSIK